MVITFKEVSLTGYKAVKCSGGCGRDLRRQKKFCQTINPFNKNAKGDVKSAREILDELKLEIAAWKKSPEICKQCQNDLG
jgi:hypothetical protein